MGKSMMIEKPRKGSDDDRCSEEGDNSKRMVVERTIAKTKKSKTTKAQVKNKRLAEYQKEEGLKADKKRAEIKARLQNKKKVKLDPSVLKSYQDKFETESKRLLTENKLAASKRRRLKNRSHYIKKRMFDQYVDKIQNGDTTREPDFHMETFSKEVKFMEMDLEKEKQKFVKLNNSGVASHKVDRTAMKEINHVSKVMKNPAFKLDPLATIRQHLDNTYSQKK